MRMLSDSFDGVGEGGSPLATTAAPLVAPATTARWAWTPSQLAQTQMTPKGTTPSFDAHTGPSLTLAALFCVLVAVLGLYSLLRCAFHYCVRRRRAHRLPGLKERVLRRMPVVRYEAEAEGGAPASAECAICLGEFEDGDAVRLLPRCRHGFHVHCIDTWLSAHSSCPICRDDSLFDEGASAATAAAGEETTAWSSFIAGMLYLA